MSLLLRVVGDHPDEEIHVYERWWGERRIDGVILLDERYRDPRIKAVERIGLPAVLCGGPVKDVAMPCLWTDQVGDAAVAVQHLVDLGHRRIAHVSGPKDVRPRARPAARGAARGRRGRGGGADGRGVVHRAADGGGDAPAAAVPPTAHRGHLRQRRDGAWPVWPRRPRARCGSRATCPCSAGTTPCSPRWCTPR